MADLKIKPIFYMRNFLLLFLLLFSVSAGAQYPPTSLKQQFKNAVALGSRDSTAFNANDSLVATIDRNGKMMYRGNGVNAPFRVLFTTNDTLSMLLPYLRKSDTASMLLPYARTSVLGGYLLKSDSLSGGYTTWLLTKKKIDSLGAVKYGGSGTINNLPKITGPNTFGNSNISDNGNFVQITGIGNSAASNSILIKNSVDSTMFFIRNNSNTVVQSLTNTEDNNEVFTIRRPNGGKIVSVTDQAAMEFGNFNFIYPSISVNATRVRAAGGLFIGQTDEATTSENIFHLNIGRPSNLNNRPASNFSGGGLVQIIGQFNPNTAVNSEFSAMQFSPVINQTGGANGVTRGIFLNPTLTAAADWRSLEWSNNTGWGFYGSGTARNYVGGRFFVGAPSEPSGVGMIGLSYSSQTNFGIVINNTFTSSSNNSYFLRKYTNGTEVANFWVNNQPGALLNLNGANGLNLNSGVIAGITRFQVTSAGRILAGPSIPADNGQTAFQLNGDLFASLGVTAQRARFTSLILNKDSVAITTTNIFATTLDTTTGRLQRIDIGSVIRGSGSANTIPRFTGARTLTNSNITDYGTMVEITGRTAVGGSPNVSTFNTLRSSLTSTINIGVNNLVNVNSSTTSLAFGYVSSLTTQAASFNLASYRHFSVNQGTFGAGSSLTDQSAYVADASLISATNNFGFRGLIPSGTGRWNTYNDGSANNHFNGRTLFGTIIDNGLDRGQFNGSVISTQYKLSSLNTAPSSASDIGQIGEIRITSDFIFVGTGTNTWKRVAISSW